MFKYISVLVVGAGLATSGCATQEQDLQTASATCAAYGYQPQTPQMAQCVQIEVNNLFNRRQAGWAALSRAGEALEGPRPMQTSTQCTTFGNRTNCTSTGF